jgi:hypothetical protein
MAPPPATITGSAPARHFLEEAAASPVLVCLRPVPICTVSGSPVTKNGTLALNWIAPPTSASQANTIVKRDGSGSFTAGTVNAVAIVANASGGVGVIANSSSSAGVFGGSNTNAGVWGTSVSGHGVFGETNGAGSAFGVFGLNNATNGVGVYDATTGSTGVGVYGFGNIGVQG